MVDRRQLATVGEQKSNARSLTKEGPRRWLDPWQRGRAFRAHAPREKPIRMVSPPVLFTGGARLRTDRAPSL